MDTSKEYILMCEKADEIQYLRPLDSEFQEGDFYGYYDEHHHYEGTYPDGKHIADWTSGIAYDDGEYGLPYKSEGYSWLPRQDQLQDMVTDYPNDIKMRRFYEWYQDNYFPTYEQDWLAFVMKERWNKTWDGKEWV